MAVYIAGLEINLIICVSQHPMLGNSNHSSAGLREPRGKKSYMKKIIRATVAILFFGAMIGLGTYSFFSDEEKSEGNTFAAGKLDLIVKVDENLLSNSILSLPDMKPGDLGEKTVKIKVDDNPACGTIAVDLKDDLDNSCTEPETVDEVSCEADNIGELNDAVNFGIWADDCDNIYESGEQFLTQGTLTGDLEYHIGELGTQEKCYGVQWCFGTMTVNEQNHTITCDGSTLSNVTQTDSFSADLVVTADQKRNQFPTGCPVDGAIIDDGDDEEEEGEVLAAFTCTTAADCNDGNPCTNETCTAGSCGYGNASNQTTCDDGNACTSFSYCSNGSCVGMDMRMYDDLDSCTWETCNPLNYAITTEFAPLGARCTSIGGSLGGGCGTSNCACNANHDCVANATPQGCSENSQCNDNNACTTDACVSGSCVFNLGASNTCDDGNALTIDSCNPSTGCMNTLCASNFYYDQDGDGYGTTMASCIPNPSGNFHATQSGDCNDGNAMISPAMTEVCGNYIDDNCAGGVDESGCYFIPFNPSITPPGGCTSHAQCSDNNGSTLDSCVNGQCTNYTMPNMPSINFHLCWFGYCS